MNKVISTAENMVEWERDRASEIKADFNYTKEELGKKYGWRAVMDAVAAFSQKIDSVYGKSRQNYRLYHVLAGSTIDSSRENEMTGFDFPLESGLSVEEFIKKGLEKAVEEESIKLKNIK